MARRNLATSENVEFHHASVDEIPLEDGSMDFGYSLGVLHHVPDTGAGIGACVRKLKPGAPFLVYLYYAFDNRPAWFRAAWKASDLLRRAICSLPFGLKKLVTDVIAATVYFPLAKLAMLFEKFGASVDVLPLSTYRKHSFYTMRTDALDRFGTRLEQRFTRDEIREMLRYGRPGRYQIQRRSAILVRGRFQKNAVNIVYLRGYVHFRPNNIGRFGGVIDQRRGIDRGGRRRAFFAGKTPQRISLQVRSDFVSIRRGSS